MPASGSLCESCTAILAGCREKAAYAFGVVKAHWEWEREMGDYEKYVHEKFYDFEKRVAAWEKDQPGGG